MMAKIANWRSVATVLFFLSMLLVLALPLKMPPNPYDEGHHVYNASRVMLGDVPYRDFWTIYAPGQFYVLAAIFQLLGTNLIVARLYDTLTRFLIAVCVYLLGVRIGARWLAVASCLTSTLLLATGIFDYAYPVFPAVLLGFLSILTLITYASTDRRRWLVLSGALIGIGSWFRHDIGLYATIAVCLTLVLLGFHRAIRRQDPNRRFRATAKDVLLVIGAQLSMVIPLYGFVAIQGDFHALWNQLIVFPTTELEGVRRLPYPSLIPSALARLGSVSFDEAYQQILPWLRFYLPLLAYGMALLWLAWFILRRDDAFEPKQVGTAAITFFGSLLFTHALGRFDYIHVIPTSIAASLVVAALLDQGARNLPRLGRAVVGIMLAAVAILYFWSPVDMLVSIADNYRPLDCYSQLRRAGCVAINPEEASAVEFIQRNSQEGESIFVGNQRHDRILLNDILFYFLADRPSPGPFAELDPGVATTLPVQKEIVSDIVSRNVRWVVLVEMPVGTEPDPGGATYLDEFIRSMYVKVSDLGRYSVWRRSAEF
jgi:Dolichyl-phosphate-mannose-protein mannosyltransferase